MTDIVRGTVIRRGNERAIAWIVAPSHLLLLPIEPRPSARRANDVILEHVPDRAMCHVNAGACIRVATMRVVERSGWLRAGPLSAGLMRDLESAVTRESMQRATGREWADDYRHRREECTAAASLF